MRDSVIAVTAALAITCAFSASALSQTAPPPGATACSGCHAGANNAMPSLQGKSASDIDSSMIAFRTGAREATVMDRIAKGFSDSETKAISEWLAKAGAAK